MDNAFLALEVVGTIAFAVSGVMAAARARMDWLGALVLAIVVAIGGGTVRDLLLGQVPVSWLQRTWPLAVAIGTGAVILVLLRLRPRTDLEDYRPLLIADAAGLSAFVILGTEIGLTADLSPFLAVMLGVLTGVGGGVIRDVLTGTKPVVFVGQIYAVAGFAGAICFVGLTQAGAPAELTVWTSVGVVLIIRALAIHRDWSLPRVIPEDTPGRLGTDHENDP